VTDPARPFQVVCSTATNYMRKGIPMSTLTTSRSRRFDVLHPVVAAAIGGAVFALTLTSGELFDLNADPHEGPALTLGEFGAYAGLVLSAILIAVWVGARARAGSPRRLSATALGLAVASAVTFVAFWSGWPHVYGAVAVALALEYRRRVGSFSGPTLIALVLGAVAFVAAAVICVLG